MNAPAKIRLHGVSLPFAPIEPDAAPRKTPLEAYQESRIPKSGAFARIAAPTAVQRQAIASEIILAQLTEPRSSMQVAEAIGEDANRVSKALSLMEQRGLVCRIKRSQHAALWCKPGTIWEGKPVSKTSKHLSRVEYLAVAAAKTAARYDQIVDLIRSGVVTVDAIFGQIERSYSALEEDLRQLRKAGRVRSSMQMIGSKRKAVYEVAQ